METSVIDASVAPFQVSASKRSGYFPKLDYHPILKSMSPDRSFDWGGLFYTNRISDEKKINYLDRPKEKEANLVHPITLKMIKKLGIRILSDRRACFAGKLLRGVIMPKKKALQWAILKRLLVWYLPCLELQGTMYHLNNDCFNVRENKFLKMYFQAFGYFWNPMLPLHFYKPL